MLITENVSPWRLLLAVAMPATACLDNSREQTRHKNTLQLTPCPLPHQLNADGQHGIAATVSGLEDQ